MTRRQALAVVAIVAALIAGPWSSAPGKDASSDVNAAIERFIAVLIKVRDHYVEPVTSKKLIDFAILGMVRGLDPEMRRFSHQDTEMLLAIRAKDSPNDTYKQIERFLQALAKTREHYTEPLAIETLIDFAIRGMLRSLDPQSLYLDQHEAQKQGATPDDSAILRDVAEIKSVPYAGVLSTGVGYIRLANFYEGSRKELDTAFANIEKQNSKGLILDLRFNMGGPIPQVAEVAEGFAPRGAKMFYTRGRDASQDRDFISSATDRHAKQPLVVLVNQRTAAGSEIVAGSVQDLDLGVVLGRTTSGMGLVQTEIPLSKSANGPTLKLTTAKVHMPSGRSIDKERRGEGVGQVEGSGALGAATSDATRAGIALPEFHTPMGRIVYGGGGIVPDLELPAAPVPQVVEDMDAKQLFPRYAKRYVKENKDVPAGYAISQQLRDDFTAFLLEEKFEYEPDSLSASRRWVESRIRRELVRQYRGDEEAYRVTLDDDEDVMTAAALVAQTSTLPQLFALIAERNRAKSSSPPGRAIDH